LTSSSHSLFVLVVVLSMALVPGASAGNESENHADVLNALRAFDESILNNMVLEARVAHALALVDSDSERPLLDVRITRLNDTWVYRADLNKDQKPPTYVPQTDRQRSGLMGATWGGRSSSRILIRRPLQITLLSEPGFYGVHDQEILYKVDKSGVFEESTRPPSVELTRWPDSLHDWRIYVPVLASGRGFSYYVDGVTEMEERPDGLLWCKAVGTSPGSAGKPNPATWELLIEPGEAYLVRKATQWTSDGKLFREFDNSGTVHYEKGPMPQSGRSRYGGNLARDIYQGDGYSEIVYVGLEQGADEGLIAEARAVFKESYPPGTRISDFRSGKLSSYQVPSEKELGAAAEELVQEMSEALEAPSSIKPTRASEGAASVENTARKGGDGPNGSSKRLLFVCSVIALAAIGAFSLFRIYNRRRHVDAAE